MARSVRNSNLISSIRINVPIATVTELNTLMKLWKSTSIADTFVLLFITVFNLNTLFSQDKKDRKSRLSIELIETFTDSQKELIEKEKKYLSKQRISIRETFTNSQKEIIIFVFCTRRVLSSFKKRLTYLKVCKENE